MKPKTLLGAIVLELASCSCSLFEPPRTAPLSEHCSAAPVAKDELAIVAHCKAKGPVLAANEAVTVISFPTRPGRIPERGRPELGEATDARGDEYEIVMLDRYCEDDAPCREVFAVWPPFEHTDSGKGIYQHGKLVGLAFAADYQYGWAVSSAEIPTIRINPIERRAP